MLQPRGDFIHLAFAIGAPVGQVFSDILVHLRIDMPESQVLQLPLDLPDTQAICQRRENIHGLLSDPLAFAFRHVAERAHIVQPVGQFN